MKKNKLLLIILAVFAVISVDAYSMTEHVFKSGDTLWELSAKYYGDPELYPILLEVNGIDNPRTIVNGKKIMIPNKDDLKKVAQEKNATSRKNLIENLFSGNNSAKSSEKSATSNEKKTDSKARATKKITGSVSFKDILKGPKVSADKLINVE
eukprot:Anaeramoba_ignava/a479394_6.p1 GENE.a479394_6~~a479394_6.p1  ORF type:complete len:153 (+),score=20.15 a479394_6:448-906(+)